MEVATLEYPKVCTRWVPRMLTQGKKEHHTQVCQDLLSQHEVEGDMWALFHHWQKHVGNGSNYTEKKQCFGGFVCLF